MKCLKYFQCNTMTKVCLFICIVAIGTLYLLIIYFNFRLELWGRSQLYFGIGVANTTPLLNSSTKLILYWNTLFGAETFYLGQGDIFKNCPGVIAGSCYATPDRTIANIEEFDAILFHGSELQTNDLPQKRKSQQLYIFTNLESPINRPITDSLFENYFNLTMTYRLDSDIPWPYAIIRDRDSGNVAWPMYPDILWKTTQHNATAADSASSSRHRMNNMQWIKEKKKTAVWFVSNCRSKSGRENYVDELKKYIDIDIYGRCGSEYCGKDDNCFKTVVEPNYYFYLSFENSLCNDYVTEKLFHAASYNVVPIVYGGANYSLMAPPKSYINALDFESPQHLAKYLKWLIERPNEYAKYFKWKEQYEVVDANKLAVCRLCRILNEKIIVKKIYNPLSMWYQSDKCPLQEKLKALPYITKSNVK